MRRVFFIVATAILMVTSKSLHAQQWAVGTNAIDYINLGTLNLEGYRSAGRYLAIGLQLRYNNWSFNKQAPENQVQNKKASVAAIVRVYPWHIYSGWFFFAKAQYQEYNRNNFLWGANRRHTEEGDAFGVGIGAGYDLMIHPNINLEFGGSVWGGYKVYTQYDCPVCGTILKAGSKGFFMPDYLFASIQFIF
ncbi:MAG: DUF3575 domain-containing protein [Bacteroidales bacterium]|nr:DUF3575 domain-containing protein [Bacteroidales bacterium]